jgi:hypothetical protein
LQVRALGLPAHQTTITRAASDLDQANPKVSPDGRYVTVDKTQYGPSGSPSITLLFAAATGERLLSIPHPDLLIAPNRFLPDNRTWICAEGGGLGFWDLDSRTKRAPNRPAVSLSAWRFPRPADTWRPGVWTAGFCSGI